MAVLLIYNGVLVGVVVIGSEARWGCEEVGKGNEIGSERSEEGGWRRWGGGGDGGNRGFDNGRGNILNQDIFGINDFTWELKLCPSVLIEWGKEVVEFGLGEADNVGGCLFTELFKIELSHSTKGFEGGLQGRQGLGSDDVGVGVNGVGLKGVGVNKEDVGVGGRSDVDGGGSRSNKRKVGDNELRAGSNGGQPGYGGGLGVAGVLEVGASRAWVVPRVVGTVEDIVDDLKGGSGIGLIDLVQVGPGGDGEGGG